MDLEALLRHHTRRYMEVALQGSEKVTKKTEDIGLDIENPTTAVSIIFLKTYPVNISDIIEIILPAFLTGLDDKGGADQLSGTAA